MAIGLAPPVAVCPRDAPAHQVPLPEPRTSPCFHLLDVGCIEQQQLPAPSGLCLPCRLDKSGLLQPLFVPNRAVRLLIALPPCPLRVPAPMSKYHVFSAAPCTFGCCLERPFCRDSFWVVQNENAKYRRRRPMYNYHRQDPVNVYTTTVEYLFAKRASRKRKQREAARSEPARISPAPPEPWHTHNPLPSNPASLASVDRWVEGKGGGRRQGKKQTGPDRLALLRAPTSASRSRRQWRRSRRSCGRRRARPWAPCGSSSATRPAPGSLTSVATPHPSPPTPPTYRLHVIDLDPSSVTSGGWLEDTSFVDKYTMSDDAYDELGTNIRKFKEKMVSKNLVSDDKQSDNQMEELCANIKGLGVHQILARTATAASVCICRVHECRRCFCLNLFSGVSSAAAT
ncbi:uncharacterized protein LOC119352493 [Triticum dicoccoides]|nr:uncharacterized protein LOC119352493 [Triticum dicoccoides]